MAVRIRMKKMGRAHRSFFRVCAFDHHAPRDGRPIEELGTYDPTVSDTDARALLKTDRIDYWLSVGAQPSEKVAVLIKKYGSQGTHVEQQIAALERLAAPKTVPDPGAPASKPKKAEESEQEETKPAETAAEETATKPAASEQAAAPAAETPADTADESAEAETTSEEETSKSDE